MFQKLDGNVGGGETIAITDRAPTIDADLDGQGMTITQDYITNIPVPGRTFESALGARRRLAGAISGGRYVAAAADQARRREARRRSSTRCSRARRTS